MLKKIFLLISLLTCLTAVSNEDDFNPLVPEDQPLTARDRENLEFARILRKYYLNKKTYEIGNSVQAVSGPPEEFLATGEGFYYTGRIVTKRWYKDYTQDLLNYLWDPDKGHRWWCGRESFTWNKDNHAWTQYFGGPNVAPGFYTAINYLYTIEGETPDWSLFPGVKCMYGCP